MSKCIINLPFSGDPEPFIQQVRSQVSNFGGKFEGDSNSGSIYVSTPLGKVAGTYQISSSIVTITITEKPMFISCGKIEDLLKSYIR